MTFAEREELDKVGRRAAVLMECEIEDRHYHVIDNTVEVDANEHHIIVIVRFRPKEVEDGS